MTQIDEILTIEHLVGRPATKRRPARDGLLPVSRNTIFRWLREDKFPPPMKLGHRNAWRRSTIERWLEEQADGGN